MKKPQYVICIKNNSYEASLELRKVYLVVSNSNIKNKLVRIIDESGEDYLYPSDFFVPITVPGSVEPLFINNR